MNIITGYRGEAHITANQIRGQNQGCFGDGSYILDVGSKLAATAISATSVQLSDGIISHQGCTASIPYGSIETVTISNGAQGMQRIDLIVARYTKDAGTGVEDMSLAVIQGTPAASNPSTPSYNQGSIHAGDSPVDMPLFEVVLDGISIDSVTQVASVVKTQAETDAEISALNTNFVDVDVSSLVNIPFTTTEKSIIKRGDIVRVHVELLLTTFVANYNYTLWIMPDSLKPKRPVFAACYQTDSNYLNTGLVTIGLRANGNVQATFEKDTSPYVFIEFEYTLA